MADEFELEHWMSRAKIAEERLASATTVLASMRHYFLGQEHGIGRGSLEKMREALRWHDQKWWTQADAMDAVAEGIAGVMAEPDPGETT